MKYNKLLSFLALAFVGLLTAQAQTTLPADSVDVLDYDVSVDLSAGKPFAGDATLTLRLTG